ncbi:MAG: hypothetical protein KH321_03305 [Clostridium sp.]|jgi:hypothetical protein|nr:hypothetical protein [Clostridium sp.]
MNNKRVCFVEIEAFDNGKKQLKRLDGLAIRGNVNRKAGSTQSEANISIANLTKADIEYLTTYTTPYVKPKTKKTINIYAGYTQTGWGRIFSGDIVNAVPEGMPDIWLNIKAQSLYYAHRIPLTYGVSNISTQELAQGIAQKLGLSFQWQATSKKTTDIFNFAGSKAELLKEFNKLDDITMYEDNGIIKVTDKITKRSEKSAKVISKDTGMIGIPEPDEFGVKVKCLLDASLSPGDWIYVKSVRLPAINGYYQIYEIIYDFANREQQFYCIIKAKAYGVA